MRDDFPRPVPGRSLAALRVKVGIEQKALADRLGIHRVTLSGIEHSPEVSPVKAAQYQNALAELISEATAPADVA